MAGSITERDFVVLHGLLDVDHVDDSGPGVPWQLMASLQELFHCDYGPSIGPGRPRSSSCSSRRWATSGSMSSSTGLE